MYLPQGVCAHAAYACMHACMHARAYVHAQTKKGARTHALARALSLTRDSLATKGGNFRSVAAPMMYQHIHVRKLTDLHITHVDMLTCVRAGRQLRHAGASACNDVGFCSDPGTWSSPHQAAARANEASRVRTAAALSAGYAGCNAVHTGHWARPVYDG